MSLEVGDAVVVLLHGSDEPCLYGRVNRIDGGYVYVATPGRSEYKCGALWVHRIDMGWQLARLHCFERYESHRGKLPYGGRFSPRELARFSVTDKAVGSG